jgi:hypothetical protein
MTRSWRPLAAAAVLKLSVCVAAADAQTVIVRSAPPGSSVEVTVNAKPAGSAKVDPGGDATVAFDLRALIGRVQMDADVYVDTCDTVRRVLIVERGQQAPVQEAACTRRDDLGFFLMRRVSTLVVNVSGTPPTVMLRQGRVNLDPQASSRPEVPTGLVVFGGAGLAQFGDFVVLACGTVTDCTGKDSLFAFTGGLDYWISRFIAAEVAYLKPAELDVNGRGTNFQFKTSLDPHIVSVAGKVGLPIGPVRLFGKVGGTYHRAVLGTSQTMDDVAIEVDGETQTIEGGTQEFEVRTGGWGWLFGGGGEIWARPSLAIYGEAGRAALKGSALDAEEGTLDERMNYFMFGVRVRIGGGR